jgi:hypothetical protein
LAAEKGVAGAGAALGDGLGATGSGFTLAAALRGTGTTTTGEGSSCSSSSSLSDSVCGSCLITSLVFRDLAGASLRAAATLLATGAAADFLVDRGSGSGRASTLAFLAGVLEVGVVDRDLDELPEAILFASSSAHSLALRLCSSMVGGGDAISAPTLFRLFLVATGDAFVSLRFIRSLYARAQRSVATLGLAANKIKSVVMQLAVTISNGSSRVTTQKPETSNFLFLFTSIACEAMKG